MVRSAVEQPSEARPRVEVSCSRTPKEPSSSHGRWDDSPDSDSFTPSLFFEYDYTQVQYFPDTDCPVDGWFQPCVGCSKMTANVAEEEGEEISICRRCSAKGFSICSAELRAPDEDVVIQSPSPSSSSDSSASESIEDLDSIDGTDLFDWTLLWGCWIGAATSPCISSHHNVHQPFCSLSSPFEACMTPTRCSQYVHQVVA
mmetsp:Transcript_11997/g.33743  ORF Transcript_11997/g.33743 Transcript_11997/m.33743 type:complete len:201 (+) Transcript_11997:422-1024(+)